MRKKIRLKNETKKQRSINLISHNTTLIDMVVNAGVSSISDTDIDMILSDLTVTQCDVSRKAVTEKKEIQILCDNDEIKNEFYKIFNPDIVSQILETYLYGLNVFEVNYKQIGDLLYPRLIQRDFRQFKFNDIGEFVYNANGSEQKILQNKVIYALNRANFRKIYGDGLLKKLYFPVKMKNASLKFWFRFLEKFGSPWAVGKTDIDPEGLAKEVQAMLAGDTAIIDKDEELNLIQPTSNIDFSKLPLYFDNQISKVILGANLTSDVSGGSYAASKTHNEIREDLAANDAKILSFVMNKAIEFFKQVNGYNKELKAKLFDEDLVNKERAERDKSLFDMGFTPTQKYITSTYNIELEEKSPQNPISNKISLKDKTLPKHLDRFDKSLDSKEFNKHSQDIDKELEFALNDILSKCSTYEEAFEKFNKLYSDYPLEELEKHMFKLMANSSIAGFVDE
ncbi:putative protein (DUF935 domain) [Campylobacter pinnipediorum subsp. caledonicus]|uniref:phage portal protein family protein n=1 Tax=Campylobacter pinnipediorum TaxID=1965231 RepID=UPI000995C635|nr:DUF935 family protein [Campylobacter pinnipediorum]AQW85472.1 putative protein (DUF935 domain) [Campylobacter pinnipediorum subsp. caledonicus]